MRCDEMMSSTASYRGLLSTHSKDWPLGVSEREVKPL